ILDRLIKEQDPAGDTMQTVYDAESNVFQTIDGNNKKWTNTFDADNRVLSQTDGAGLTSSQVYDRAGNVILSKDNNGKPTQTWFDADNRPWLSMDPNYHFTQTGYDPFSEVVALSD